MRKNTWYAVYHQRELDFLARSYQPGYFFILMGRKPLTEYLRVDGLNAMLKPLRFKASGVEKYAFVAGASQLLLTVYGGYVNDTSLRDLRLRQLIAAVLVMSDDIVEKTAAAGVTIDGLLIKDGGLPSAGDITGLAGKTITMPAVVASVMATSPYNNVQGRTAHLPLDAEPIGKAASEMCCADRANWDPLGRGAGGPYLVFYDGFAWKAVSAP